MAAEVRRVPGVELVKVGSWETSTMDWQVTRETLAHIVEAFEHSGVRRPVIKLGHTDHRFAGDGEPAFGHVDNVRTTEDGMTLVGDLVMPAWLADAAPMHFADRSVEALIDYNVNGRTWPCVLEAVSLLGAERPAVSTLASLQDLVAASRRRVVVVNPTHTRTPDHRTTVVVAAARRRRAAIRQPHAER